MKELKNNNNPKAIEHLMESLKLYSTILNQNNSIISKNENSLAKCFAIIGKKSKKQIITCILWTYYRYF